jgi:hypothetical protein
MDQGAGDYGANGKAEHDRPAGGDRGQPRRPLGRGIDDAGGEAAAGEPGAEAYEEPPGDQDAYRRHVQQHEAAQSQQPEAGKGRGAPTQVIGESPNRVLSVATEYVTTVIEMPALVKPSSAR